MPVSLSPFDDALAALHAGEIARLRALIAEEPLLLHLRAEARPPLSYFSGATLLHHVAGNPGWDELRGFGTATVAIAAALLDAGVEPDATTLGPPACTTMALVATSRQASDADLSAPLIDVLRAHGAALDLRTPGVLDAPLSNHAPRAAQANDRARGAGRSVRRRRARRSRAGAGRLRRSRPAAREVWRQGHALTDREAIGLALLFAYVNTSRSWSTRCFERDGDWNVIGVQNGTALHRAAWAGDLEMVQRLVARGADPSDRNSPFVVDALRLGDHNRQAAVAAWFRASGHVDLRDAVSHDLGGRDRVTAARRSRRGEPAPRAREHPGGNGPALGRGAQPAVRGPPAAGARGAGQPAGRARPDAARPCHRAERYGRVCDPRPARRPSIGARRARRARGTTGYEPQAA